MAASKPATLGSLLSRSSQLHPARYVSWQSWREVVGTRVAQRSRPRALEGKTLHVTVNSSAWAQELSFLAPTIVEKLNERGHAISSLRFSVGSVELPTRAAEAVRHVERDALPSDLLERLKELDDPKLRELIEEAASYRRPTEK